MNKNTLRLLFIIILLSDIIFSYIQHSHGALDGDIARIVVPAEGYKKVMTDPFGIGVIVNKESYAAPNRFFAHWTLMHYFRNMPFVLQNFFSPIDSVYISAALAKSIMQTTIIFILAMFITKKNIGLSFEFLLGAVLVTPFFQNAGYYDYMAIIDGAITYSFFYALPVLFLLIYFLPFYNNSFMQYQKWKKLIIHIFLILLAIYISFNGPLIPAIVLIVCPLVISRLVIKYFIKSDGTGFINKIFRAISEINKPLLYHFIFISLLCLYSFYIGTYNSENSASPYSIEESYHKIISSIVSYLFTKLSWIIMIVMVLINLFIIKRQKRNRPSQIITCYNFIGIFILIYLLLLPFGGYRPYRPNILRWDTLMPITLSVIFLYGLSSFYLLTKLIGRSKIFYIVIIAIISLIYTNADAEIIRKNEFEKIGIQEIVEAKDNPALLKFQGWIMTWERPTDPRDSELNAELLNYWGITKEKKLYYQRIIQ